MNKIKSEQLVQIINNLSDEYLSKINNLVADDQEICLEDKISLWTYGATCISMKAVEHLVVSQLFTKDDALAYTKMFMQNLKTHISEIKTPKKGK